MSRTRPLLERRTTARTLGVATLLLAIVGCAAPSAEVSQAPGSIRPQASVSASPEATASPTLTPSPAPSEPLPSASGPSASRADIAEVVTTDLVMRSAPGAGPDSEIYSPSLSAPVLLYILDGPLAADGYDWYRVVPFDDPISDIGIVRPHLGWVAAAGKDGETWIAPWSGTCPAPTAEDLMWRSQLVALACFGGQELTLEGTLGEFGDCFDSGPDILPSFWLRVSCVLVPFGAPAGRLLAGFGFYPDSASRPVGPGEPLRVTGHYDDPAASTCAGADLGPELVPTPPELNVLGCRARFVSTELTPTSAP